ncbi:MAG: MinD/ParA family protein [Candidatus Aureabacteria bacterium]|nr:MinD/ParA family protein [Candidatus Auribacterota bacterium]
MENSHSQTYSLRQLASQRKRQPRQLSRAVSITSGKGGVGKSNIAINLGLALQDMGKNVTILDADLGLANVDVLLGKKPLYNINHVIEGEKKISEVIMEVQNGLKIIPASSGIEKLANLEQEKMDQFIHDLKEVEKNVDFFLIDTAAGITQEVLGFLTSSNEIIVVTTGEPTAITDAYAIIKSIHHKKTQAAIRIIVNMCKTDEEAEKIFSRIHAVSQRFLSRKLDFLGGIPYDEAVSLSVRAQKPFIALHPRCRASVSIRMIAKKILENRTYKNTGTLQDFFNNIKGFLS